MPPDIYINDKEFNALWTELYAAAEAIGEVAAGAYVTGGMFTNSRGVASDSMTEALNLLVKTTGTLQEIGYKLADYMAYIFEGFEDVDARLAQEAMNYQRADEWTRNADPGASVTASDRGHNNSPRNPTPVPDR